MAGQTKKRGGKGELLPFSHLADMGASGEAIKLDRLKKAWPFFAGQGNALKTRPLSIRHGMLVIGCHDSSLLTDLRAIVNEIWPTLRDKVNAALNLRLQKIDILPCDPEPQETAPKKADASPDPLDAVLKFYQRASSKKNGQSGQD